MSLITDQRMLLKLALSLAVDLDYLIQSIKSDPTDLNHEARPTFINGIRLFVENAINGETPDLTMLDDYDEMPEAPPEAPPENMGLIENSLIVTTELGSASSSMSLGPQRSQDSADQQSHTESLSQTKVTEPMPTVSPQDIGLIDNFSVATTELGSAPSEPLSLAKVTDPAPAASPQHMELIVNTLMTAAKLSAKSSEPSNRATATEPTLVADAPVVLDTPKTAAIIPKPPAPTKSLQPTKKAPPQLATAIPSIPPSLSPGHLDPEKFADKCIGLLNVPGHVTSSMVAEQIFGGPLRSLEKVPHRGHKVSNFFISFLYQKASLAYMSFREAPTGKLYFAAYNENGYAPIKVELSSSKKPEPITTDLLEGLEAPNPVRRVLTIRDYPRTTVGQDEYSRRLKILKTKYASDFTLESFKILRGSRARVVFSRISGAIQVMAWHSRGLFGSEFNDCQVAYGIDPTDRPIPVTNNEHVVSAAPVKVKPAGISSKEGAPTAPKATSSVPLGSARNPTGLLDHQRRALPPAPTPAPTTAGAPSKPSGPLPMSGPLPVSSVTTSRNATSLTARPSNLLASIHQTDLRTSSHRFILSASASNSSAPAYTLPESLCLSRSAPRP